MTISDLLAPAVKPPAVKPPAVKRWAVALLGALLTGLAVFWTTTVPPVYFVQVRVVLLPPASAQPNGFTETAESLIDLAGVVAREVRAEDGSAEAVSPDVTLVGEGVHAGYAVRHPNSGGQWQHRFDEPMLDVQAVGVTPKDAREQASLALQQVTSTLARIQDGQGVSARNRVRTVLSPATPQLHKETGSRVRAVAASMLTGTLITLIALGGLGPGPNAVVRRPRRKSSSSARSSSAAPSMD